MKMPDFRMKEDIHKNIKYINNKLGDENWVPLQINSLIREGMLSDGVLTWGAKSRSSEDASHFILL